MSYGFGIVGIGMIAEFHAKAIAAMNGGELVACYSRSSEKAADFSSRFGGEGHTDYDQFLKTKGLDIVTICTPSGAHLDPALKAAAAGKHLIIEKPIEVNLDRCDAIIEAGRRNGIQIAGIFPSRYHEVNRIVKETIESGRLGRVSLADAYVKWFRSQEYYDEGGWKGTKQFDGGGALMNQSIHAIDLLQWFMGPIVSVQALTDTLTHERIEVEDTAVAALRFANGALGVIEGATSVYPGFLKRIEISGNDGTIILEEEDLKVWEFRNEKPIDREIRNTYQSTTATGGGAADPSAIGFHGHQKQFEEFCESLAQNRPLLVDGAEARKSVEIILAIYRSAETGSLVKLPLK